MKKRYALFILSFLLVLSLSLFSMGAAASELDDLGLGADELTLSLAMDSELKIVRLTSDAMISDLEWQISYNPIDNWQQTVLSKEISPKSVDPSGLIFRWAKPEEDLYRFSLDSEIRVKNDQVKIRKAVAFPLSNVDDEAKPYLNPTGNADSDNPKIIAKATELVSGQEDLNHAAFSLFSWVADNIEYRRTDFTQNTAQSASWTLENRYGVCDELTNLFIALARSVGIPGKYVSGIAYTNIGAKDVWEPHAWAELYFPGYGWVPFDPTYREYGYIDPTHIALLYGTDSNQSSSGARWVGRETQIVQTQLSINAALLEKEGSAPDVVSLSVRPLKDELAFGSYTLIEADVRNPNDYYVSTDLSLVPTTYFSTQDRLKQGVLLAPHDEKSVFWLVGIKEDFSRKFDYTLPIVVMTSRGTAASSEAYANSRGQYYSKEEMEELRENLQEEAQYHYSRNIELACSPEKEELYTYETVAISCEIRNTGNTPLEGINVCLDVQSGTQPGAQCTTLSLPIARSSGLNFTIVPSGPGVFDNSITARSPDLYKTATLGYTVLDEPSLSIDELSYPKEISFGGAYNLSCLIRHLSLSPAYNVTLAITNRQTAYYNFSSLEMTQPVILGFEGSNLRFGPNPITLTLKYHDKNGREYTSAENITITLSEATFIERIELLLIELSLWVEKVFQ